MCHYRDIQGIKSVVCSCVSRFCCVFLSSCFDKAYVPTSCVQWADLREPALSPKTWTDNQENQKLQTETSRRQLPSSLSPNTEAMRWPCFHGLLEDMKRIEVFSLFKANPPSQSIKQNVEL